MLSMRVKFLTLISGLFLLAAPHFGEAQAVNFGAVAIGQTAAAQPVTLTFTGAGSVASQLALTNGAQAQDFAAASGGSCNTGQSYSVGGTCTVSVTFSPRFAGLRRGAVVLKDAGGTVLASTYIFGVGSGPQAGFQVGTGVASLPYLGITADKGIAVDGYGNLFVSSYSSTTAADSVVEIPAGCSVSTCIKQLPGSFGAVWGLAVDGAGNVWVGDVEASGTVTEIPASGGYVATKTISGSFGNQIGIAVDGSGNVFFTGSGSGSAYSVMELPAAAGYSTVKTLANNYNSLGGIAVDASGDVFFADFFDRVIKEIVAVGGSIPATPTINTIGSGLLGLQDVAVEGSGDLVVTTAYTGSSAVTEFLASSGYATSTVISNGFNGPEGLAGTAGGDLYIVDAGAFGGASVFEIGRAAVPAITFNTPTPPGETDTADGTQNVLLENLGNQPMAISGLVLSSGNFSLDGGTTCTSTGSLAAGESCNLGIQFNPTTTGAQITGTLSVSDNTLNAAGSTQNLALTGAGLFTPVISVGFSAQVIAVTQTLTLSVTVHGGNGNPTPTGTVQVAAVGYTTPAVALVNGSATLTIPPGALTPGTYTLAFAYVPDTASASVYTPQTADGSVTVTSTLLNVPVITVTPAVPAVAQGQALSVTVAVGQTSGSPVPTGTVVLAGGNYQSPPTALSGGTVTITIPANSLILGTDELIATYTPDSASATIYVPASAAGFVAVSAVATASAGTPVDFGSIGVGKTSATQPVTLTFPANSTPATLIATTQGATGKDFSIVSGGTCGAGVNVATGQSCTVNVTFTPAFAGVRNGAVLALDGSGQTLALTYIHGSGNGAQITFQSKPYYAYYGVQTAGYPFSFTTLSDGFSHPNVAVDGAGNVFEADLVSGSVNEIPAGCTNSSCTVTILQAFYGPSGIAVDGAGNIFVSEVGNGDVRKIPPGCKSYTCMQTIGSGFNQPYGVSVDSSGNVFVADTFNNAIKEVVAAGGYTTIKTLGTGLDLPWSVVVNAGGDLFVAEGGDQCTTFLIPGSCSFINTSLVELPAASGYQTVNTLASGGFGKPFGLAIDGGGNVYEADYGDSCSAEYSPGSGYASALRLCSPVSPIFPEGMAVDGAGNLYLDDVIKGAIYKMDLVDPPSMNFRTATLQGIADVQDGPQAIEIQNNGTTPMTFSSIVLSDSSLKFDSLNTCTASTPLAVGSSCILAVDFLPTRTGPINATLTLTDNNLNQSSAAQVIQITAVALPPTPVILTNPANSTTATSATFTFSDTQTPITFVCSIDSLPFSACSSPANYSALSGGAHAFQVKAKDSAGNLSLAATYNWLVNSIGPPAPIITSAPAYLTNDDTATFAFTDTQSGVTFQCSLDGAAFAPCTSGVNYSGLAGFANNYYIATKRHTFAVKAMDGSGNFSPVTNRAWTDFSIPLSAYPVDFGLVPVGQTSAPQSVTFQFIANPTVGKPGTVATIDALTMGSTGLDFTISDPGTCAVGTAIVYGTTCTLKVTFTPKYPGQRKGGVILLDAAGNGLGEAYIQGTGTAPQVTFAPYSIVPYNILAPQNNSNPGLNLVAPVTSAAIDGAGNVYVTDELIASVDQTVSVSSGDIWKFPVGCTGPTCSKLVSTSGGTGTFSILPLPLDLNIDGDGVFWVTNSYFTPFDYPSIGVFYPGQCTDIPGQAGGFYSTATDAAGNLAMLGGGLLQSCFNNLGTGQISQTISFDFSTNTPSLAIDPQNDFIVADAGNNSIKEVLASSGYTIDRILGSGFNAPAGVASDAYGNIYVSDSGNNAIKEITASSGYTQVLTLASFGSTGISPQNLAVDALGNVYIATTSVSAANYTPGLDGQLVKLDFADAPALSFPTQTKIGTTDTTDGTLTATVKNNGNQPLTLTGLALSNTNFSLDAGATTCSTSTPLAAGASCTVGVLFTPNGTVALTGTLTLTDNALNASGSTQLFALSGTGFLTAPTSTPTVTVTPSSSSITTAQTDAITVTVVGKSGGPTPTGTISLVGGNYTSATVSLSGGSASFTLPAAALAVGSTTLNAVYTPDTASSTTYGVAAGSASIAVSAINAITPTVTVTPAAFDVNTQQSLAVTITVSGGGGSNPTPTGTVTLSGGNFASFATTLSNGVATITIPAGYLPAGADTLTAFYTPDYAAQPNYTSASGTGQVSVEATLKLTPAVTVTPAASTIQTTQSLQVTLQVAGGSGKPTPTGSIVLSNGSYTSPAAALAQGSVTFSIPAGALAAGSDTLTASYTPDNASNLTFNNASGNAAVTVDAPLTSTATMLQASATPVVSGTSVTFTVTVAPVSGTVIPTGQVLLTDGSSTLTTLTLNGSGAASYSTAALGVGSHLIAAAYQGDSTNAASSSPAVTVVVTAPTVQVTVGTTPAGLSFSVDGTAYTSPQTLTWTVGSSHTLATTSSQTSGGTQSTFASWTDAGAISHGVTAPSSATSFTASFSTAYQLTTAASPSADGSVSPASGTYYAAGTVVNLTATPNSGYLFANWTGSVASPTSASTTVTMNAPQSITANFTAAPSFTVSSTATAQTVTRGGTATFAISVAPVNGSYSSAVTLSVSGLPAGAAAAFAPASLTPGSSPATSTLTIQIAQSTAGLVQWPIAMPTLAVIGLLIVPRRRRWITLALLLFVSLGTLTAMSGCGGGFASPGASATTYNITVTGTSGAAQQSTIVKLTVQ
jgi:sugar lactone lactonase YvrE